MRDRGRLCRPGFFISREEFSMVNRIVMALAIVAVAGIAIAGVRGQEAGFGTATPIASPVASPAAVPTGRSVSVASAVTINIFDYGFDPMYVESTNGHDLTVTLINAGTRKHAFRIDALNVDVQLAPGESRTIVIENPPLGDYPYYSDAPDDDEFAGQLTFYI
jgi:hypothetical protein